MATTKKLAASGSSYGNTASGSYSAQDVNHLYVGKYKTTTYRSRLTIPAISSIAEIGTDRIKITAIKLYVRPNDGSSFSFKVGCSTSSAWGATLNASATKTVSPSEGYQEIDISTFADAVAGYESKWYLHMLPNAANPSNYIRIDSTAKTMKPYLAITWEKVAATISGDQDSVVLGDTTVTFTITPEVTGETHTLTYAIGDSEGPIVTNAGNSITWTPPLALASEIPNDDSGIVEIHMTAYDSAGNVQRTETYYQTVKVPETIKPSISDVGATIVNDLSGYMLAGHSRLSIAPVIDMTGTYGASIRELTATVTGGASIRWTELDETDPGVFKAAAALTDMLAEGAVEVTITVTDSRGRKASSTASGTVLPYSPPEIAQFSVERYEAVYDANETIAGYVASDVGDHIWVNLSIITASVKPSTTELNTISWTIVGESASGGTMTKSGTAQTLEQNRTQFSTTVAEDESWTFTITVTDAAGSTAKQYSVVAPGHAAFSISPDKWGAAVGMIANGTKAKPMFEVADKYESRFYGGIFGADGYRLDGSGRSEVLTIANGKFDAYNNDLTPRISRIGSVVFLDGFLRNIEDLEAGFSESVATLPEWAIPAIDASAIHQGSGGALFWLRVNDKGNIQVSRYQKGGTYVAAAAGRQFPLTIRWIAGRASASVPDDGGTVSVYDDGSGNVTLTETVAGTLTHEYSNGNLIVTRLAGYTASDDGNGNVILT